MSPTLRRTSSQIWGSSSEPYVLLTSTDTRELPNKNQSALSTRPNCCSAVSMRSVTSSSTLPARRRGGCNDHSGRIVTGSSNLDIRRRRRATHRCDNGKEPGNGAAPPTDVQYPRSGAPSSSRRASKPSRMSAIPAVTTCSPAPATTRILHHRPAQVTFRWLTIISATTHTTACPEPALLMAVGGRRTPAPAYAPQALQRDLSRHSRQNDDLFGSLHFKLHVIGFGLRIWRGGELNEFGGKGTMLLIQKGHLATHRFAVCFFRVYRQDKGFGDIHLI